MRHAEEVGTNINHILRKATTNNCLTAMAWAPEGRRKRAKVEKQMKMNC